MKVGNLKFKIIMHPLHINMAAVAAIQMVPESRTSLMYKDCLMLDIFSIACMPALPATAINAAKMSGKP